MHMAARTQCEGQSAPHTMESPSAQKTGVPEAQATMSQSCVPATPTFGQVTMQLAPVGQIV
jgi:hypothetical protein